MGQLAPGGDADGLTLEHVAQQAAVAAGFAAGGVDLGLAVGAVFALDSADGTQGSGYYATSNDAAITVLSLTAAKEVPITTEFALPMFGQYIVNPETERSFLLFGISL